MSRDETGKEYLEHYGVLGMKWGVRKQPDGGTAKTGSASDDSTGYDPKSPGARAGEDRKIAKRAAKATKKQIKKVTKEGRKEALGRSRAEKKARDEKHVNAVIDQVFKSGETTIVTVTNPGGGGRVFKGEDFAKKVQKGMGFYAERVSVKDYSGKGYANEHHRHAFSQEKMSEINKLMKQYAEQYERSQR